MHTFELVLIGFIFGLMVACEIVSLPTQEELDRYENETRDKGKWPDED